MGRGGRMYCAILMALKQSHAVRCFICWVLHGHLLVFTVIERWRCVVALLFPSRVYPTEALVLLVGCSNFSNSLNLLCPLPIYWASNVGHGESPC